MPHPSETPVSFYYRGTFTQTIAHALNSCGASPWDRLRVLPVHIVKKVVEPGLEKRFTKYYAHEPKSLSVPYQKSPQS